MYCVYSIKPYVLSLYGCLLGSTTLQTGDQDVELSGESIATCRFNGIFLSGRRTVVKVATFVQYYIDGKGIKNPSRKKAQLLHLAGMEVQDIYIYLHIRCRIFFNRLCKVNPENRLVLYYVL